MSEQAAVGRCWEKTSELPGVGTFPHSLTPPSLMTPESCVTDVKMAVVFRPSLIISSPVMALLLLPLTNGVHFSRILGSALALSLNFLPNENGGSDPDSPSLQRQGDGYTSALSFLTMARHRELAQAMPLKESSQGCSRSADTQSIPKSRGNSHLCDLRQHPDTEGGSTWSRRVTSQPTDGD